MNIKNKGIAGRWKSATGRCALLFMSSCSTALTFAEHHIDILGPDIR